jgi:hypothetical protein
MKAPCTMATAKYGIGAWVKNGPGCPALHFDGEMYRCADYDPIYWEIIFGDGCTSGLNTWRTDVKRR